MPFEGGLADAAESLYRRHFCCFILLEDLELSVEPFELDFKCHVLIFFVSDYFFIVAFFFKHFFELLLAIMKAHLQVSVFLTGDVDVGKE